MTDLYTLLTLPVTSNAFSALPDLDRAASGLDDADGSASPLRKTPRLDSSYDSASASRHRSGATRARTGPVQIQLVGEPIKPPSEAVHDQNFARVKHCIRTLLTRHALESLPMSYEGIYRTCRFVVTVSNRPARLYDGLKLDLEQCVGSLANDLVQNMSDPTQWMGLFVETCQWFETQVSLLKSLLTYLDQAYLIHNTDLLSVGDLAFSLFFDRILQNPRIVDYLKESMRHWVTWEREQRQEHEMRPRIKELVTHLAVHGQYHPLFESFYLDLTRLFYVAESTERSEAFKDEAQNFIVHVNARVREELQRCLAVLPEGSWRLVEEVTESALTGGRLDWLATGALSFFMSAKDEKGIGTLFRLFSRVSGLKVLSVAFKADVMTTVQNIVKDPLLDDAMVQRLLDFKGFADSLVSNVFVDETMRPSSTTGNTTSDETEPPSTQAPTPGNSLFSYALIDAFQTGFRARRNIPAEMIAKYMDKAMREPNDKSPSDFEKRMDAVLALYRFTDDKDVFRTFYHRALAKRLLLGRSASDDDEKMMLKKLKEQYDPEFGMGDHMFNDLALSREMMREFHSKCGPSSPAHKLTVVVLQQSVWPFAPRKSTVDLSPSASMQDGLTRFATYYKGKHQGRKLEWDHALSTMTLKGRFVAGQKELSVSLYQGVVLLLFNEATEWTYSEILEQTRIGDAELRRTLQSLACGKKRVLKKSPVGRDVEDVDVFRFNADFTDPRPKVHINSIQVKETPEESRRTQNSVEGDRKYYLDAAIVRIMKARKELSYEKLKVATIDAVKSHFVPEVSSVKQRIQVLVEQEYLQRDDEDMNKYLYVA